MAPIQLRSGAKWPELRPTTAGFPWSPARVGAKESCNSCPDIYPTGDGVFTYEPAGLHDSPRMIELA